MKLLDLGIVFFRFNSIILSESEKIIDFNIEIANEIVAIFANKLQILHDFISIAGERSEFGFED